MAAKLSQRPSLNKITEGQEIQKNEVEDEKPTKQRKVSQFAIDPSRHRPLGAGGIFKVTHTDNPSIKHNSVTFAAQQRGSSDQYSIADSQDQDLRARLKSTFQLRPKKIFNAFDVKAVIQEVFESVFADSKSLTTPKSLLCKSLTEAIKLKTRKLGYERYKILATVYIGTKENLALKVTSRCVWDDRWDNYADCTYKTKDFYVLGVVYGIYKE